jgi:hypothetical protein
MNPVAPSSVGTVNLPMLGSRDSPHSIFQYLLHSLDAESAQFGVPSWVVRREHFEVGDRVDLHFPFRTADGWHRQEGEIVAVSFDAEQGEQSCRVELRNRAPLHHPVFIEMTAGRLELRGEGGEPVAATELLPRLLRDCHLLKRGVAVYLKHLVPLFSRITLFPREEYGSLREHVLEDVRRRVEANVETLAGWRTRAEAGDLSLANLSQDLDLETLRGVIEAEIDENLFAATFESPAIRPYTAAIRLLEHKLYLNYNTLVLLYAHAL